MKFKDEQGWIDGKKLNSNDPYRARIYSYAEDWANLMETQLTAGRAVRVCAKETSVEADTDGITGFMYGAAVRVLSESWEHGEELRCWHNLDTQISNEGEKANQTGGTLNPALLNIEVENNG